MNDKVGVASNRAGEMSVIGLGETKVTERLRRVARSLQTFQESDLERLFLRFAGKRGEQSL